MEAEVLHHTKKTRAKTVHFLLAMGRRPCGGAGPGGGGGAGPGGGGGAVPPQSLVIV